MQFVRELLPQLEAGSEPGVVFSILSAGYHGVYPHWQQDFELRDHFSLKNAADSAGLYNDLGLEAVASRHSGVRCVHWAPGFVASSWGTELPGLVRCLVRGLQVFGRSIYDAGEYAVGCMQEAKTGTSGHVYLYGPSASKASPTSIHSDETASSIWASTERVLDRVVAARK